MKTHEAWGVVWRSENSLDGKTRRLMGGARIRRPAEFSGYVTICFSSRREAREYIAKEYGYLRHWDDLRREPHGWKMPLPVRVKVTVKEIQP